MISLKILFSVQSILRILIAKYVFMKNKCSNTAFESNWKLYQSKRLLFGVYNGAFLLKKMWMNLLLIMPWRKKLHI